MNDRMPDPLKKWRYNHLVRHEWNAEDPVARFNIQIKNAVEELQKNENLEAPFRIEADIRILPPEGEENLP